ncbi:hypothetical protein Nepgr_018681 [Nepenthes gracilis]|uniref:Integrase catalytic domain-containing protein n=1 Tax=Nepenthes gracilis TaxID=150966 RepID=A0AAD3STW9_NEPGR|nr:hypothetical protein Nepgr_018681 [Nepenthes gracilis]
MREILNAPSIEKREALQIFEAKNWMTRFLNYLADGSLLEDVEKAKRVKKTAGWYAVADGRLYRRGYSTPYLRCLTPEEADYALSEVHLGICGSHIGGKNLVFKPSADLKALHAPWPFAQWGLDLLSPFPIATGQRKFIIVDIDYFTKWVKLFPLVKIIEHNVLEFLRQSIICRFSIPKVVVTNNGTLFSGKCFTKCCTSLGIKFVHTSVAYPQANGQVEVTNRTLLDGLKTKLEDAGGSWADEFPSVLWSYRTTPKEPMREKPFSLCYGTEAVIPIEIRLPSLRVESFDPLTKS